MQTMTIGRLAKEAGVNLDTIRQARLADVERKIKELEQVRDGLKALIEACPGHGAPESCPIIAALSKEIAE